LEISDSNYKYNIYIGWYRTIQSIGPTYSPIHWTNQLSNLLNQASAQPILSNLLHQLIGPTYILSNQWDQPNLFMTYWANLLDQPIVEPIGPTQPILWLIGQTYRTNLLSIQLDKPLLSNLLDQPIFQPIIEQPIFHLIRKFKHNISNTKMKHYRSLDVVTVSHYR